MGRSSHNYKNFIENIIPSSGCWIWDGPYSWQGGYGKCKINKKSDFAHRISYKLWKGKIPKQFVVRHKCDNKFCVNPDHLILGTKKDNALDAVERGQIAFGERQGLSKLTDAKVAEIFKMRMTGVSTLEIAKIFNVTRDNILAVLNGKTWRHVPRPNGLATIDSRYKNNLRI